MAHVSLSHRSVICRLHQRVTLTVTEHMQMSTRRRKAGRGRKDGEKKKMRKKKRSVVILHGEFSFFALYLNRQVSIGWTRLTLPVYVYVWWADGIREQSCYIVERYNMPTYLGRYSDD